MISLFNPAIGDEFAKMLGGNTPPGARPAAASPALPGPQLTPSASLAPAGPSAPPMPVVNAPHTPSLSERLRDDITGGDPAGYEGLLTPQEIASTRPSLFHAIFHSDEGSASDLQRGKLDHLVAMKQATVQIQRQQQIQADRDAFLKANPAPASGDPNEMAAWVSKALPYAYMHGDFESVKELAPLADKILTPGPSGPAGDRYINDKTGAIGYFDKRAGSVVPPGWSLIKTGGNGTPPIFTGMKNGKPDYVAVDLGNPQQMADLVAKGYKPDIDERTQYVQQNTNGRFDRNYVRQSVNDFNSEIKPLATKAQTINSAENVLAQALTSKSPDVQAALTGPAISQFVQSVEQSQNLRYQLLQYYSQHIDNSFHGTWALLRQRILTGTLPGNKLQAMKEIVDQAKLLTQQEIQARRDNRVKIDDRLDGVLPDAGSFFQTVTPPVASSGGFDFDQWLKDHPPAGRQP